MNCYECGEYVTEDDAVWVDPQTTEAKGPPDGEPYHVECAPAQEEDES